MAPHPFVAWNAALLSGFFTPAFAGEQVFLSVGRSELNDLAPELGGYEGLLEAVRLGPQWTTDRDLAAIARRLIWQRKHDGERKQGYVDPATLLAFASPSDRMPTYLPIVAALVALHAEGEGGHGGFYERVQDKLRLDRRWGTAELEQVNGLWGDLEEWTGPKGTNGKYGRFEASILGQQAQVGQLRAQGIFRSTDADRLGAVFARVGVRPGEDFSEATADALLEAIQGGHGLSLGLRSAAADRVYKNIVVERLRQILADWDGHVRNDTPGRPAGKASGRLSTAEAPRIRALALSLHLSDGSPPWRLGWRVPEEGGDGQVVLEVAGSPHKWIAVLNGNAEATAFPEGRAEGGCSLLETARTAGERGIDVRFAARTGPTLRFRHAILRYFVYDGTDNCLVERDELPANGPAYMLVAPDNTNINLVPALKRAVQPCPSEGLPSGWALLHVPECAKLSGVPLPDGRESSPQARVVRLVGGVRIRRGGRLLFLSYDLPTLELDAPLEATVVSDDLTLDEERPTNVAPKGFHLGSLRRFRLRVDENTRRQNFTIEARTRSGQRIGSATLRLAMGESWVTTGTSMVGLDDAGASTSATPHIAGMSLDARLEKDTLMPFRIAAGRLGTILEGAAVDEASAEARFLDSLAQGKAVAIPFGEARDRLRRFLGAEGRTDSVSTLLRDLRRRAHVEIVTDARGRWTAVGKVRPTLFRLPIEADGQAVWGVAGTLGFQRVGALASLGGERRWEKAAASRIGVVRVIGPVSPEAAASNGFATVSTPCLDIARFSVSLRQYCDRLEKNYSEQLDARVHDLERFRPMNAEWTHGFEGPDWVLLRYTDPDTEAHRLLSLRNRASNQMRFRHIRDERWGTWIAYESCVDWATIALNDTALRPWRLPYYPSTGALWLPARMNLPYVLERALTAASGSPPIESRLTPADFGDGKLWGVSGLDDIIGPFTRHYAPFLEPSGRTWLNYRWIPAPLADVVAAKLGCELSTLETSTR